MKSISISVTLVVSSAHHLLWHVYLQYMYYIIFTDELSNVILLLTLLSGAKKI